MTGIEVVTIVVLGIILAIQVIILERNKPKSQLYQVRQLLDYQRDNIEGNNALSQIEQEAATRAMEQLWEAIYKHFDLGEKERNMTIQEMKQEIDYMSYYQLLRRWRKAPRGDVFFQGEVGDYYSKAMFKKKGELPDSEAVKISKEIGF